ncbi:MAG: 6-carboxytetrahydropterin synthase [Candidatus Krumholzibacteriota bacterium]|nr:6-carboxytetrahydropterin synthase [Candidatus Krumholzibacteriota bacterium]
MENKKNVYYTVSTEVQFSASHLLRDYPGDCARLHGHNWVVRAYYRFTALGDDGISADYIKLKSDLSRELLPRFDHRNLNEVKPFDRKNPTSENIAAEIFRICRENIHYEGGKLVEIELWETPTDMVRYGER